MIIGKAIRKVVRQFGYDIVPRPADPKENLPPDLSKEVKEIIARVQPFTMTSVERLVALIEAVRYLSANRIEGAFVECGVWRGGSTMAALLALLSIGDTSREVFLYDTFEGMSAPTEADRSFDGVSAAEQLASTAKNQGIWCAASLEDVKANVLSTGYPAARIHFVQGKVEQTIPATLPGPTALLRLDTDWYESTRHELAHLFPLLHRRGILIIDDYGHWAGARKAVDEFFSQQPKSFYFHRIDYTGRLVLRVNG